MIYALALPNNSSTTIGPTWLMSTNNNSCGMRVFCKAISVYDCYCNQACLLVYQHLWMISLDGASLIQVSGHFYVSRDRVGSVCRHIKERKAKRSKKGKKERKKKNPITYILKDSGIAWDHNGRSTDVGVGWGRGVYIGVDEEGSTIL